MTPPAGCTYEINLPRPTVASVYLLRCRNGALYCGWASNLEARLRLHQNGKGARSVRMAGFESLACSWQVDSRSEALRLEAAIKRLTKVQKEALVRAPETLSALAVRLGIPLKD